MTDPIRLDTPADHGGDLARAIALYGGAREDWLDLSTGINPIPYPLPPIPEALWHALPDADLVAAAEAAARFCWSVPDGMEVVFAGGASAIIAALPALMAPGPVDIAAPTYNEHARAFAHGGWEVRSVRAPAEDAEAYVVVSPNNPDGRIWRDLADPTRLAVIDESFADVRDGRRTPFGPRRVVLKSFGKFWGLAGLRLGAAIAEPDIAARLRARLGPWAASGPALHVAAQALGDQDWIQRTRGRIAQDADRLDGLLLPHVQQKVGGAGLFATYRLEDAAEMHHRLAERRIWTRVFPYDPTWIRFGLPGEAPGWDRLGNALA
ncbi:MAG: aminotransferase class I/II-fold pyridoxal phosphate-dependent enzyme [Pseudomonadota bacterium]